METPRFFVRELLKGGWGEEDIQSELAKLKVRVDLSTINRIKNGRIKRTGSDIALGLLRLYEQRKGQSTQGAQASAA